MAERAAMLAKADLVTGMVYEFPGASRRDGPVLRAGAGRA